jgi:hypothetical protein
MPQENGARAQDERCKDGASVALLKALSHRHPKTLRPQQPKTSGKVTRGGTAKRILQ